MNDSETNKTQERLSIELLEYGKPVSEIKHEQKNGRVTVSDDGVTSWETLKLNDRRLSDADRELAETLREIKTNINIYEEQKGLRIKAGSCVGQVAFTNFDLVIYPKFKYLATTQKNADGSKEYSSLATLLLYAFGYKNYKFKITGNRIRTTNIFSAEVLIHALLEEIHSIQRRGLFQQYSKERRDLAVIRGKIDMKTWLRRGCVPSERMPCKFYERSLDNILNQTLCAGLRHCISITSNPYLKSRCRFHADDFTLSVTEKPLSNQMLDHASRKLNRLNAHYENAINLITLLYRGSGGFFLGDQHEKQTHIPGFFFDMNMLFENVMARFLKENLPKKRYKIEAQESFKVFSGHKQHKPDSKPRSLTVRPDIIISKTKENEIMVLDTKYRDYTNILSKKSNKGISANLYQLSIYALTCSKYSDQKDSKRQARIIYPSNPQSVENELDNIQEQHIDLHHAEKLIGKNKLCKVTLCAVNLHNLVQKIRNNNEQNRQQYALKIIGDS